MKLYTFDPAPNPKRLAMFMAHKGIELPTQQISLMEKEQMSEAYTQINPKRTVPALQLDSGEVLTEVIGICAYLERLYPDKPLMGSNALEKAQVLSACHEIFVEGLQAIADILRNGNPAFADRALPGPVDCPQIPELVERGQLRLDAFIRGMDKRLQKQDTVVASGLTLADIDLFAVVEFMGWVKASVPEECQALRAWQTRVATAFGS